MPANYRIEKYDSRYKAQWDSCVTASKNGTFLHYRDFMEYHSDRFEDFSIMVFEGDKTVAVLPANRVGDNVHSHQGLTYGGLIYGPKLKLAGVIKILRELLEFLSESGIRTLHFKSIPAIYHKQPAQEAEYALFTAGAKLVRRDTLFVYEFGAFQKISDSRLHCIKKARKNNLEVKEVSGFEDFWTKILIPNLEEKHNAKPVHTFQEMEALKKNFPEKIKQFGVYEGGELIAGTTIFITDTLAHAQYISGRRDKNHLGGLDVLYSYILGYFKDKKYFDFGPANEAHGMKVNAGLAFWKESFGARTTVQDYYEVETGNFTMLENVLT